jgi:hypothetical protein
VLDALSLQGGFCASLCENHCVTDGRGDPFFDWSRVFHERDVVRLPDGRLGVAVAPDDCSEDSNPPDWEMYVESRDRLGNDTTGYWRCRDCTPASDALSRAEAERLGLFSRSKGA